VRVALDVSAVPARPAGAGRYVVELARRLPEGGDEITLVARRGDGARWRAWSPASRVVTPVPIARPVRLAYEAVAAGLGRAARAADVWHGPHYTMPRTGTTPAVVTIHDLTFFTNPEWHERAKVHYFRRAITYAARHAAVLVSVSAYTARVLDEVLAEHAPVVVAPHGVDLTRFDPRDRDDDERMRRAGWPTHVPYVAFVGTLEPRKGLDVLLGAFATIAREDREVELWIAGQRGWGDAFEAQVAAHPAAARIRRLGFVEDDLVPVLLRRARVVAYPSRGEGFGLPVLEALACGSVVVTSADTVMAEVAGDAATLVPVGDANALADALADALDLGANQRAAVGLAARRRAALFTWDASLAQHRRAYAMAALR
jgi:glycosyltransferase involved in cell wall biosynthesis